MQESGMADDEQVTIAKIGAIITLKRHLQPLLMFSCLTIGFSLEHPLLGREDLQDTGDRILAARC